MVETEIERKFLVYAPDVVLDWPEQFLEQNYLAIGEDHSEIRIRNSGCDDCSLTVKKGTGLERMEAEIPITSQQYLELFHFKVGTIEKVRYRAPDNFEIDLYRRPQITPGFYIVEKEFPSREAAEAFTKNIAESLAVLFSNQLRACIEVTEDLRFKNQVIAEKGFPLEVFEQLLQSV